MRVVTVGGSKRRLWRELLGQGLCLPNAVYFHRDYGSRTGRSVDTLFWTCNPAAMGTRSKRTYNLSTQTLARVRELAGEYGAAPSQDAVVELAVDRLYAEVQDLKEAASWSQAAEDPEFRAEMGAVSADFKDGATWPR